MASRHKSMKGPGNLSLANTPMAFPFLDPLIVSISFAKFFLSLSSLSLVKSLRVGISLFDPPSSWRKNSIFFLLARNEMDSYNKAKVTIYILFSFYH